MHHTFEPRRALDLYVKRKYSAGIFAYGQIVKFSSCDGRGMTKWPLWEYRACNVYPYLPIVHVYSASKWRDLRPWWLGVMISVYERSEISEFVFLLTNAKHTTLVLLLSSSAPSDFNDELLLLLEWCRCITDYRFVVQISPKNYSNRNDDLTSNYVAPEDVSVYAVLCCLVMANCSCRVVLLFRRAWSFS